MTYPKLLALVTFLLFAMIVVLALMKGDKSAPKVVPVIANPSTERANTAPPAISIELGHNVREVKPAAVEEVNAIEVAVVSSKEEIPVPALVPVASKSSEMLPPDVDRIEMLFSKVGPRLPFVETITYKSHVSWHKGRPAWLSDYAAHYNTSRHFIARSLNGRPDYLKQDLADGDRFNVFRKDMNISFYLLVDLSRSKMWFYAIDEDSNERFLIKSYPVGLGRVDAQRVSGLLTPRGKYSLGSKIAIYKPKMQGFYNGKKIEMIGVFGSRWIPFDKEIGNCTAPAKGLGLHGVPWHMSQDGELAEDSSSLGKYESDGCVRLATDDMEELFAIIITKPTVVELVADFGDAVLPGVEKPSTSTFQ